MPQYVIERDVPGAHKMSESEVRELARKSVAALEELGPQIQWIQRQHESRAGQNIAAKRDVQPKLHEG